MIMSLVLTPAYSADCLALEQLVAAVRLPLAGLRDQFPQAFILAREGATLVGAAGLEGYGTAGLLRSVAVLPIHQARNIGTALVENRLRHAAELRLSEVFLLTMTAAPYFARFGFKLVERREAPPAMLQSPEFTDACPGSAACLVWRH